MSTAISQLRELNGQTVSLGNLRPILSGARFEANDRYPAEFSTRKFVHSVLLAGEIRGWFTYIGGAHWQIDVPDQTQDLQELFD